MDALAGANEAGLRIDVGLTCFLVVLSRALKVFGVCRPLGFGDLKLGAAPSLSNSL